MSTFGEGIFLHPRRFSNPKFQKLLELSSCLEITAIPIQVYVWKGSLGGGGGKMQNNKYLRTAMFQSRVQVIRKSVVNHIFWTYGEK